MTDLNTPPLDRVLYLIGLEVLRAQRLHTEPHHSPHESLGVIEEEFIEFRDEVFAFNPAKNRDTRFEMHTELVQLAAMAVRAILDLKLPESR